MNRPGQAVSLYEGLFLSQLEGCKLKVCHSLETSLKLSHQVLIQNYCLVLKIQRFS